MNLHFWICKVKEVSPSKICSFIKLTSRAELPLSFKACTAKECITFSTFTSLTWRMMSLTLKKKKKDCRSKKFFKKRDHRIYRKLHTGLQEISSEGIILSIYFFGNLYQELNGTPYLNGGCPRAISYRFTVYIAYIMQQVCEMISNEIVTLRRLSLRD